MKIMMLSTQVFFREFRAKYVAFLRSSSVAERPLKQLKVRSVQWNVACYFLKRSPQNNETSRVYSDSKLTYKYHTSTSTNASAGAALGTPLEGPLGPFLRPQRDFKLFLKINMINFWRPKFRSIWAQGKGLAIFHVLCFSASNFPPFPGAAGLSVATFPVLWNEPNWPHQTWIFRSIPTSCFQASADSTGAGCGSWGARLPSRFRSAVFDEMNNMRI